MKSKSLFLELLKFFAALIVGWLLFAIIFSAFVSKNGDALPDFYGRLSLILAFAVAVLFSIITNYNKIKRMSELANSSKSNISINQKRAEKLLSQANRVVEKYLKHEHDTQTTVAQYRSGNAADLPTQIKTSTDFRIVIEQYPDLKARESVQQLLEQIVNCENLVAESKMAYNRVSADYNSMIRSFPNNFFKSLWKLTPKNYYEEDTDMISDEMLGI